MHAWSADGKRVIEVDDANEQPDVVDWEETECQVCGTVTAMDYKDGMYVCSQCKCVQDNTHKL